ncbi:choline dehydrogenase [Alternaria panax]|uniref:Choline dehydrogenase n=1 Tax=Alternaria panax TaxID=48097 RepID=A0AAD4IKM0_9PLEO|nr:choline dehydrogenase [Alternaria panax]
MAPLGSISADLALLSLKALSATSINSKTYKYIVIGSGPGSGPLVSNLARAGHSALLLEAEDDQTENLNVSNCLDFSLVGNDSVTRWGFFVKHSDYEATEARYLHRTWRKTDRGSYVGIEAPEDSNAFRIISIMKCSHEDMTKHLVKLEKVHHNSTYGHGHDSWLDMTTLDPGYTTSVDAKQFSQFAAQAVGYSAFCASTLLQRDMHGAQADRDQLVGPFGGVSHVNPNGHRASPGYYTRDTAASGKYPLAISLDTLATSIISGKTSPGLPKAVGIDADPRFNSNDKGVAGKAFASKEVIISGGAFNLPQLLMLDWNYLGFGKFTIAGMERSNHYTLQRYRALDLPVELCLIVYEHPPNETAFYNIKEDRTDRATCLTLEIVRVLDAILCTCREVRMEANEVMKKKQALVALAPTRLVIRKREDSTLNALDCGGKEILTICSANWVLGI